MHLRDPTGFTRGDGHGAKRVQQRQLRAIEIVKTGRRVDSAALLGMGNSGPR
jgi:hypothetical protein